MLDFRINTFLTVCEYMNFTKAAEKLCITQPAVSQHIKYLEKVYETKLFKYEGKKIELTHSGKLLLQTALTMKYDEKYLKDLIKEESNGIKRIKFGATLTIGEFIMPEKIHNYNRKLKEIKLDMIVANTSRLLTKLEHGDIDFALIEGYFTKKDYDYIVYSKEKYICVCGSKYNISDKEYEIDDLLNETLIIREKGSGTRDILEKNLEDKNLCTSDFKNVMQIGNINAIKYLVKNNDGITFLYEAAVKEELKNKTLRKIEVTDLYTNHNFYFIWRKNSEFSRVYRELAEELQK